MIVSRPTLTWLAGLVCAAKGLPYGSSWTAVSHSGSGCNGCGGNSPWPGGIYDWFGGNDQWTGVNDQWTSVNDQWTGANDQWTGGSQHTGHGCTGHGCQPDNWQPTPTPWITIPCDKSIPCPPAPCPKPIPCPPAPCPKPIPCLPVPCVVKQATVYLVPGSRSKGSVTGNLKLTVIPPKNEVIISGKIEGLLPGFHGFHVHMKGDLSNECKGAGPHFNPSGHTHGGQTDETRHAGDLGNIFTPNGSMPTTVAIIDHKISLGDGSPFDVAGRAIVVHAEEDDLGLGGDVESTKTGNAGSRVACGIIQIIN